jgi:hypothetical protein
MARDYQPADFQRAKSRSGLAAVNCKFLKVAGSLHLSGVDVWYRALVERGWCLRPHERWELNHLIHGRMRRGEGWRSVGGSGRCGRRCGI